MFVYVNVLYCLRWLMYFHVFHGLSLQWHHNGHNGISNHQPHDWLLNRLFKCRSKKTSMLPVTGLYAGNSLATNVETVSIWWHHHVMMSWHGKVSYITGSLRGKIHQLVDSPLKWPVMQTFGDLFLVSLNKLVNKQSRCWWFSILTGVINLSWNDSLHCHSHSDDKMADILRMTS